MLLLTILGGYSAEHIGEIYGKSSNNVRVIIHNAKNKIKKNFKGGN